MEGFPAGEQMKIWRVAKKYLIVYSLLLIAFILLVTAVSALPSERIKRHIQKSLPMLETEGDYPKLGGIQSNSQLDNFTDSIFLNIIYEIDNSKPFIAAVSDQYYFGPKVDGHESPVKYLKAVIEENEKPNTQYYRYWQGNIVFLRPLFLFGTLQNIRNLYQLFFLLLFSIISVLIYKRISLAAALAFSVSLALINFIVIPFSIQLSSVFFIAFIFMIILLLLPNLSLEKAGLLFFIIGAITIYVDLISTPLITFGLPVIILLLLRERSAIKNSFQSDFSILVCTGISWAAGYILLWVSKWGLASIILRENVFANAIQEAIKWGGVTQPAYINIRIPLQIYAITLNIHTLFIDSWPFNWLFIYVLTVFVPFLVLFIFWHRKLRDLSLSIFLLTIAVIPYFWFIALAKTSVIQFWFTYRVQVISIMAILCSMYYAINWTKFSVTYNNKISPLKQLFSRWSSRR
jgi:hypothetical protein